jgi:hypothetical protein
MSSDSKNPDVFEALDRLRGYYNATKQPAQMEKWRGEIGARVKVED